MQISSRFTIAIHIFACISTFEKERKVTSDFLASSVKVNPVVIRRILVQLKAAGLVNVQRGAGGATIVRPLEEINLLDIYKAVECVEDGALFHFHEKPDRECPVGRNIHNVLDEKLERVQKAMECEMESITLADIIKDLELYLSKENPLRKTK